MKKILYIYKSKFPWDVRVEKICKSLADNNYDVTILARYSNEIDAIDSIGNVKIIRFGKNKARILSAPIYFNPFWKKFITKTIDDLKPDLIIVREMHIAEMSAKVANKRNIPIIMDMAENYPAAMKEFKSYNNSFIKRFIIHKLKIPDRIEKKSVRLMNGIITVCNEQNVRLITQFSINPENLAIVHNTPINIERNHLPKNFEKNILTLGHHGHLTAEKSLEIFLKAFAEFSKTNHNVRLIIAGGGDCSDDYKNILKENNAIRYVEFTGEYKIDELPNILDRIDIGFIPYKITDFNNYTIHNKVFDFWMQSIPIVLSKSVPFMRIIEDTKAGMLLDCESTEPIVEFLKHLEFYDWEYFSKNAEFFSKNKYNWENDAIVLVDYIKKMIKQYDY